MGLKNMDNKEEEIEIEINNDGVMLINRQGNKHNAILFEIMQEIGVSNIDQIEDFLKENNIDLLFGDEVLCG